MATDEVDLELGTVNGTGSPTQANGQNGTRLSYRLPVTGRPRRGTFGSVQSHVSRVASIPLQFIRKVTNRQPQEPESPLSEDDRLARDEFFMLVLGEDGSASPNGNVDVMSPQCKWMEKFLECKFRTAWTTLLCPALMGLRETSTDPLPDELAIVYRFLSIIAKLLIEVRGIALVDILDQLANDHFLKHQKDTERAIPNQLAFVATGWLTMLFDPAPRQPPGELEIRRSRSSNYRKMTLARTSRTFISYKQKGFEDFDQPMYIFLRRFGYVVPEIRADLVGEPELIAVSYVCFAMLDKVADIKIEWVNSLSLHLEFDNVRRILKIFRFPSFCRLMYRETGLDTTLMSRLYLDHADHFREHGIEDQGEDRSQEYLREILLSYRLIFGQDKASWKAFNRRLPSFEATWDCSDHHSDDRDPMLLTLCGSAWESPAANVIYQAIDADDISPYYYPDSDFPFLGRRILNLQAFVRGRNPHDWRALWHDRRNVAFWWTFWAVLFIGGGTIFLAFVSLAFQIWSSISSQQQVPKSS